jgi:hypothetical protein
VTTLIFSEAQSAIVNRLLVHDMGTEMFAPLMHYLLRFTRARNVVEGGAGYTTPFLAMALAANRRQFDAELEDLRLKSESYIAELETLIASDPSSRPEGHESPKASMGLRALYKEKASLLAQKRFEWLQKYPSWARPGYYSCAYTPQLFCIDALSSARSSAAQVPNVIEELGLSSCVTFQDTDFWSFDPRSLPSQHTPIDVVFVDLHVGVKELISLMEGAYWNCLRPDGGLLVIHDMLTTRGGQGLIDAVKKQQKGSRFNDFELVGLLEPQRLMQGDFILIRKTLGKRCEPVDEMIQSPSSDILEQEAQNLVSSRRSWDKVD